MIAVGRRRSAWSSRLDGTDRRSVWPYSHCRDARYFTSSAFRLPISGVAAISAAQFACMPTIAAPDLAPAARRRQSFPRCARCIEGRHLRPASTDFGRRRANADRGLTIARKEVADAAYARAVLISSGCCRCRARRILAGVKTVKNLTDERRA